MRKFRIDANKKIKATIIPYRQSTDDLINNEGLDDRFAWDMEDTFELDLDGDIVTCLTVDSEVVPISDYTFWYEDDELREEPTGIKYTVLVPIPVRCVKITSFENMMGVVSRSMTIHFEQEFEGTDYWADIGNITGKVEDYDYLMGLAEDKLPNLADNVGYYLVEVIVMPVCP